MTDYLKTILDHSNYKSLNLVKIPEGWQVSVERVTGTFSIGRHSTPCGAIADAFRLHLIPPAPTVG